MQYEGEGSTKIQFISNLWTDILNLLNANNKEQLFIKMLLLFATGGISRDFAYHLIVNICLFLKNVCIFFLLTQDLLIPGFEEVYRKWVKQLPATLHTKILKEKLKKEIQYSILFYNRLNKYRNIHTMLLYLLIG